MSQSNLTPLAAPPRLLFRVPPEPSHLLRARERVRDYLRQYCAEPRVIDDVVLCVEEACTNAIRHGGSPDEIEIVLRFTETSLAATVKDHGRGFDVARFDPEARPDLLLDHGRGLFIIAALMGSLELRVDGGLEVHMACHATPRCETTSLESGLPAPHLSDDVGRHDIRARALLEEIDEAFVALDWEYRYVHVNEAMLRFTQTSRDELLGHVIWDLFPQLRGTAVQDHYRQAMELGIPSVFEHRAVVTSDWLEIRIYPTAVGVSAYYREINERKRKELQREELLAALRDSEERYRELFQSESDAILLIDQESGRVLEANMAAEAMYGYTTDELLGLTDLDLSAEPELSRAASCSAVVGETMSVPHRTHRRKDGTTFPAEVTGRVFGFRGHLVRVAAVRDVTARRQTEEALGRFELLAANSRDIILFMDRDGRIIEANEAAERAYGYSRDELLKLTIADLRATQSQAEIAAQMAEADERGVLFESLHRRRDGSVFPVEVSSRGATVGGRRTLVSIVRDIAERKHAEEMLRASEEGVRFLADVVEHAEMPFGVGAPDGRLILFNQAFADLTGYSREELETRQLTWATDLTPPEWLEPEARILAEATAAHRSVRYEKEYLRKDGSRVPIELFVQPVFGAAGELVHYRSFLTDISERKQAEEALRDSEERYRSIVELATERLVEEPGSGLAIEAKDRPEAGSRTALSTTHRRRQRLVEVISAQRWHPVRTTIVALALEFAYLVPLGLSPTRSILGVPGSLLAFTVIVVGAIAGTWPGVVSALGGTAIFYFTVSGRGQHSSPLAVLISAGIWVAAAVLSSLLADTLIEQSVRRREAAVAFVQAETARREQSDELRNAQRIATTLQETLLHPLPTVAGLELGVVSRPASAPELVGGDFSDVFVLDDGQVAILIGDVAGKGVEAAGLTETVRSSVRAFAAVDPAPAFVLEKTNELLLRHDFDGPHVTAFYCLLEPSTGHLAYASAGHPAPIHLGPQAGRPLDVRFGPPLGSFERSYEGAHATLSLDDYLVLYTDGVTEARRAGELYGETRLTKALADLRGLSAQELADDLVSAVGTYADRLADDLQVVTLRLD